MALPVDAGNGGAPQAQTFPLPSPIAANVVEETLADGTVVKQLRTSHGKCYQVVRTLFPALMGKVKLWVECSRDPAAGVWSVANDKAGRPRYVAIKHLSKYCIRMGVTVDGRRVAENPMQEISVLASLGDPGHINVLKMIELLEDAEWLYIVLEFVDGGELFEQVQKHGKVPEPLARDMFWQCLQGVKYIHAKGLAHRDLSLENAMLSNHPVVGAVKIIDFGLSVGLPPAGYLLNADGRVGKERYMSPETFALQPYDPRRVDVWTLGMCLFVLLFGLYPYQVASVKHCRYFAEIAAGRLVQLLQAWNFASAVTPEALSLVNWILTVDPAHRPTIAEIEAHPWFKGFTPSVPESPIPPPVCVTLPHTPGRPLGGTGAAGVAAGAWPTSPHGGAALSPGAAGGPTRGAPD